MGYIGNTSPLTPESNVYPDIQFFSGNGSATTFQLNRPVRSIASMIVVVNNVIQKPGDAFSVNASNQIVFTSVPSAGSNNIYVIYQGTFNTVVSPPLGTGVVNENNIALNAVTSSRIANGSITSSKLDVASASGTGAMTLPGGTTAQRPGTPATGAMRFNSTSRQAEMYDGIKWVPFTPKLGTVTFPATSARAIIEAGDSAGDGVYWIQSTSGAVPIYCDMTNGGYMLVAKIGSSQDDNWMYNGSYWTGTTPINEAGCQNLSDEDSVSRLYYEFVMSLGFRMCLGTVSNALLESRTGGTARSFFTGGQTSSANSRAQFLSWVQTGTGAAASNWDNQANCNVAGFNVTSVSGVGMRWGITMNNEGDCNSNDSCIGFGTFSNSQTTVGSGVRNVNAGGHRWNGDQRFPGLGYIFVR